MTLETDVRKLEEQAGVGDPESAWCECPKEQDITVTWEGLDADPGIPEPEICERCGKPVPRLIVDWNGILVKDV